MCMCLGIDILSCYRATGLNSGVYEEQTMLLALAWPYTVCVCSVLHVLLSGGYPLEMNRLCIWADNIQYAWVAANAAKLCLEGKLGDFS